MALGDITFLDRNNGTGTKGSLKFNVAASSTLIYPGEPVAIALGNSTGNVVTPAADGFPVVGTTYTCGIAQSTSTNTASAAGTVEVTPVGSDDVLLCAPKTAATWDTQAEYDALVGARITIDLTSGSYTMDASDGATNGCVVMPLDITKYPGKVAFSIRNGANFLA